MEEVYRSKGRDVSLHHSTGERIMIGFPSGPEKDPFVVLRLKVNPNEHCLVSV